MLGTMTVSEAARFLGISRVAVLLAINRGQLEVLQRITTGKRTVLILLDASEVERYARTRHVHYRKRCTDEGR